MSFTHSSLTSPVITVLQPDVLAPIERLGPWIFAEGAILNTLRMFEGDEIPTLAQCGDGLVILGGLDNAHADDNAPWLPQMRILLREAVEANMPVLAICLGAQIAGHALGGTVEVPSTQGSEYGIVDLTATADAEHDTVMNEILLEGTRAAVRAGLPTPDDMTFPVPTMHDDAVAVLPPGATLLGSTAGCVNTVWRLGRLLALQHHPEVTPERHAISAATLARLQKRPSDEIEAEYNRVLEHTMEIEPVTQACGRALARGFVKRARAYQAESSSASMMS